MYKLYHLYVKKKTIKIQDRSRRYHFNCQCIHLNDVTDILLHIHVCLTLT